MQADSELLIRQLQRRYRLRAENLPPLFEEPQAFPQSFDSVPLTRVPREQNVLADRLADRALDAVRRGRCNPRKAADAL
ncbi:MAG: reverse transcriptase-like protein [Chloroflexi bacterium]|nr:reverse transcriptase-like protein [Chloroflexota bacterium]